MNTRHQYLKEEKNNIMRRLVNHSLNYKDPECEEIQSDSIELINEIDETIKNLAKKYNTTEEKIKTVLKHFKLN